MPDHIQISFADLQPEQQDILVAHLAEIGFESFEEKEHTLNAFIPENHFDESLLQNIVFKFQLSYQQEKIPEKNWNETWESQFHPVIIDHFAGIRSEFHPPITTVQHEIIITPKMSFGTGHHATTRMMIEQMKEISFPGRSVLDFGTGTGILAILAKKLGAAGVVALDNDEWSIENARENFERNKVTSIQLTHSAIDSIDVEFDIILANINKNTILENFGQLVEKLLKPGTVLISGILSEDENAMEELAIKYGLQKVKVLTETNWCCLRFDY